MTLDRNGWRRIAPGQFEGTALRMLPRRAVHPDWFNIVRPGDVLRVGARLRVVRETRHVIHHRTGERRLWSLTFAIKGHSRYRPPDVHFGTADLLYRRVEYVGARVKLDKPLDVAFTCAIDRTCNPYRHARDVVPFHVALDMP